MYQIQYQYQTSHKFTIPKNSKTQIKEKHITVTIMMDYLIKSKQKIKLDDIDNLSLSIANTVKKFEV